MTSLLLLGSLLALQITLRWLSVGCMWLAEAFQGAADLFDR